jgi:hypothetical protein
LWYNRLKGVSYMLIVVDEKTKRINLHAFEDHVWEKTNKTNFEELVALANSKFADSDTSKSISELFEEIIDDGERDGY